MIDFVIFVWTFGMIASLAPAGRGRRNGEVAAPAAGITPADGTPYWHAPFSEN